jgi:hypothetical protein
MVCWIRRRVSCAGPRWLKLTLHAGRRADRVLFASLRQRW